MTFRAVHPQRGFPFAGPVSAATSSCGKRLWKTLTESFEPRPHPSLAQHTEVTGSWPEVGLCGPGVAAGVAEPRPLAGVATGVAAPALHRLR